ncbi:MAG: aminodeoxychorismate/anthranilate synthase component II [Actinobacteria bacterium]|nr:aminodeoxychorismate/anthranilate synthase component II [Actinomycetota bacterium]
MTRRRIFVIDNYDSFTYNLVQELGELGAQVEVARNDMFSLDDVSAADPDGIVVSPGPGTPADAGMSNDVIVAFGATVPLLGVCLGHQCIAHVFGGRVRRTQQLLHGKTSPIHHDGSGVFSGLANPIVATRYHSLIVDDAALPPALEVTARTPDGLIMGLRHRELPLEGVQFHPESILTTSGMDLLRNFVRRCAPVGVG